MFSHSDLIAVWEARRSNPEHASEPKSTFYAWRIIISVICSIVFVSCQISIPLFVILIDKNLPKLSQSIIGTIMVTLIVLGFAIGFALCKIIDKVLTKVECRKHLPHHGA